MSGPEPEPHAAKDAVGPPEHQTYSPPPGPSFGPPEPDQPAPPRPAPPAPQSYPQPWPAQPAYPHPAYPLAGYGYGAPLRDHPRATTALVLGIVGLVGGMACVLPILASPFAWVQGVKARREIDAQPGLGGRGQATAGMVTGIIGTVLLGLAVAFVVLVVVLAATGALDDPGPGSSGYSGTNAAGRLPQP